jgi:hypothetical protein
VSAKGSKKSDNKSKSNFFKNSEIMMRSMIYQQIKKSEKLIRKKGIKSENMKKKSNSVYIKNQLKKKNIFPQKYMVIMKEFDQWFTEDYFENCLILDGEFGFDYFGEFKEQSDTTSKASSKKSGNKIKRSFLKKNKVEEFHETKDVKTILSSHVSSNERLPMALSNEYTVSNNRNQFGREVKQIWEEKSRQILQNTSNNLEIESKSELLDENFDSIQFSFFLNKLRIVLGLMKQKQESNKKIGIRSKSSDSKGFKQLNKKSRENHKLRKTHSSKNIDIYDYSLKMSILNTSNSITGNQKCTSIMNRKSENRFGYLFEIS